MKKDDPVILHSAVEEFEKIKVDFDGNSDEDVILYIPQLADDPAKGIIGNRVTIPRYPHTNINRMCLTIFNN